MKIDLYKRISRCENREENDAIIEEVKDRFGEPPRAFNRLLDIAYLKAIAHKAYLTDVKYVLDEVRFIMLPTAPVKPERMDSLLKRYKGNMKFVTGKQTGFYLKAQKTVQDELIATVEKGINDIMLLIGGNEDESDREN